MHISVNTHVKAVKSIIFILLDSLAPRKRQHLQDLAVYNILARSVNPVSCRICRMYPVLRAAFPMQLFDR
jgi:hypothetical protein